MSFVPPMSNSQLGVYEQNNQTLPESTLSVTEEPTSTDDIHGVEEAAKMVISIRFSQSVIPSTFINTPYENKTAIDDILDDPLFSEDNVYSKRLTSFITGMFHYITLKKAESVFMLSMVSDRSISHDINKERLPFLLRSFDSNTSSILSLMENSIQNEYIKNQGSYWTFCPQEFYAKCSRIISKNLYESSICLGNSCPENAMVSNWHMNTISKTNIVMYNKNQTHAITQQHLVLIRNSAGAISAVAHNAIYQYLKRVWFIGVALGVGMTHSRINHDNLSDKWCFNYDSFCHDMNGILGSGIITKLNYIFENIEFVTESEKKCTVHLLKVIEAGIMIYENAINRTFLSNRPNKIYKWFNANDSPDIFPRVFTAFCDKNKEIITLIRKITQNSLPVHSHKRRRVT